LEEKRGRVEEHENERKIKLILFHEYQILMLKINAIMNNLERRN
jgi:hypothetical protein